MSAGSGGEHPVAGGPARHIPVLLAEALEVLAPRAGGVYCDGTFGAGGYSRAILATPGARILAIDRDPDAIAAGRAMAAQSDGRLDLAEGRFGDLETIARAHGVSALDGVALDVGVSSMQFDEAARGFSFQHDAPLDMRMEKTGRTAADILAEEDEETIADILFHYGEERNSRRIARAIVADRPTTPYVSTRQLAAMIERVAPARPNDRIHPATRSFQALRIAVNDELGELVGGLIGAEALLAPGGALAVVTFHSLEDRIVKQFLARRSGRGQAQSRLLPGEPARPEPTFECPPPQPIAPGAGEVAANPRARSAKLRHGVRTDAAARGADESIRALAALPTRNRGRG
jgi:16S rRNA (cytosine1402-N4)-methyltransferase